MTTSDQKRLAQIRAQSLKWRALDKESRYWNDTFLLGILDKVVEENESLKRRLLNTRLAR
jgi:hypothetical protein